MPRFHLGISFAFILLLMGLGGSSYFYFTPSTPIIAPPDSIVEESMSLIRATRFDKEGRLNQTITMDSWQHLKNETVTTMVAPQLKMIYENGTICEISAQKGEGFQADMKGPFEKLHLIENVVVQQIGQSPDAWWELNTNSLLYFPLSETAMTDDSVTVLSPSLSVQAQGLRAYLNQQRVEFIHRVTSHYAKSS